MYRINFYYITYVWTHYIPISETSSLILGTTKARAYIQKRNGPRIFKQANQILSFPITITEPPNIDKHVPSDIRIPWLLAVLQWDRQFINIVLTFSIFFSRLRGRGKGETSHRSECMCMHDRPRKMGKSRVLWGWKCTFPVQRSNINRIKVFPLNRSACGPSRTWGINDPTMKVFKLFFLWCQNILLFCVVETWMVRI